MTRRPFRVLALAFTLIAASCGGADRPTLDDPTVQSPTDDAVLTTDTATDLVDGSTRTVSDLTDEALALGNPLEDGTSRFRVDIVGARAHDEAAFTQGLEFVGEQLYESRGQYGESALTEIDPITGSVLRAVGLSEDYFAEGITVVEDRIIMLTWREGRAFVYDTVSLRQVGEFSYGGEGWGLCHDGQSLFMSDGTSVLTRRDPDTFDRLENIQVTLDDIPVLQLNELECIEGKIWANVWTKDAIVVIDPATGEVQAQIDATALRQSLDGETAEVLNGIALDPSTGRLLLTGKYWDTMFEVELVPCDNDCTPDLLGLD